MGSGRSSAWVCHRVRNPPRTARFVATPLCCSLGTSACHRSSPTRRDCRRPIPALHENAAPRAWSHTGTFRRAQAYWAPSDGQITKLTKQRIDWPEGCLDESWLSRANAVQWKLRTDRHLVSGRPRRHALNKSYSWRNCCGHIDDENGAIEMIPAINEDGIRIGATNEPITKHQNGHAPIGHSPENERINSIHMRTIAPSWSDLSASHGVMVRLHGTHADDLRQDRTSRPPLLWTAPPAATRAAHAAMRRTGVATRPTRR